MYSYMCGILCHITQHVYSYMCGILCHITQHVYSYMCGILHHITYVYSVPSDEENVDRIKDFISEYYEQCEEHDCVVNQHDVDKDHLKANKSDDPEG